MIQVFINSIDRSNLIDWSSLSVQQQITSQVDSATFLYRKYGDRVFVPNVGDTVEILDNSVYVFAGTITRIDEEVEAGKGVVYNVSCVDWSYQFNSRLVGAVYENKTIKEIIEDIVTNYTTGGFTANNVQSDFFIRKIVFNQVSALACLRRLADIVSFEWYIDNTKDIHFFSKFTNTAPFNLTDDSGNYDYKSLKRVVDGTQIANVCKVRGGMYDGELLTEVFEVVGSTTKVINLPYRYSNLVVELDSGSGYVPLSVGIDFLDDPADFDVLYNYQEKVLRFPSDLGVGDLIRYTGNPKTPVLAIASDPVSIQEFGRKEKIIRDNSIEDLQTARMRAFAEINIYKDEVADITFTTKKNGLKAGQTMHIQSTERDIDGDFIVSKVSLRTIDPYNFQYLVGVVSTRRYGLIEYLRQINDIDARQAQDDEVAEEIIVDIVDVRIQEHIDFPSISPTPDDQDISVSEDYALNPLGDNVEPVYVIGNYVPTPWATDTQRGARIGISFTIY